MREGTKGKSFSRNDKWERGKEDAFVIKSSKKKRDFGWECQ